MKLKIIVSPNQIFPKFKIGNRVHNVGFSEDFVITHIYFKDGIITYAIKSCTPVFLRFPDTPSVKHEWYCPLMVAENKLELID